MEIYLPQRSRMHWGTKCEQDNWKVYKRPIVASVFLKAGGSISCFFIFFYRRLLCLFRFRNVSVMSQEFGIWLPCFAKRKIAPSLQSLLGHTVYLYQRIKPLLLDEMQNFTQHEPGFITNLVADKNLKHSHKTSHSNNDKHLTTTKRNVLLHIFKHF